MITDGKPTCLKTKDGYYKNSNGLDEMIVNKCLTLAQHCRKLKIPITTFMVTSDPYLQQFVKDFTEANKGKAYFSGLQGLGGYIFEDFEKNKKLLDELKELNDTYKKELSEFAQNDPELIEAYNNDIKIFKEII